jgi:gamma-glutamylcyclotransferase (GGCT)/AIG2-like uncharacterized protein YtfP
MHKIFVYGTLKQGFGNWAAYLSKAKMLGTCAIDGIMFHLGGYPAINLEEPLLKIKGEVYEIDENTLTMLDGLEGVPYHYNRSQVHTPYSEKTWVYIYPHDRAARQEFVIPDGNWRGPHTEKVRWLGFGKGVSMPDLTNAAKPLPLGQHKFHLVPSAVRPNMLDLVDKETGQILGSYRHLGDFMTRDGAIKPKIALPPQKQELDRTVPTVITSPKVEEKKERSRPKLREA